MNSFSAKNREALIEQLSEDEFDLLVIGGGITGGGIALDAAVRGLKVALIEMQDFASGTSGRSTKLIHGGLRYLKQLDLRLVAEVGKEREIIHRIAPHLTRVEKMLLPISKYGSLGMFSSRIAMYIYEWLAGVKKQEKHRVLSREGLLKSEPLLKKQDMLGGILFYEYRTDDSRLTIEVLKEAAARGAVIVNYLKATEFIFQNNKIRGAKAEDLLHGRDIEIKARHVVNAGGPWVDALDKLDNTAQINKLRLTKGIHIVLPFEKLPVQQSLYFDTYDKRMIFVIRRENKTYVGTTDTFYEGDMPHPEPSHIDVSYLLRCLNDYFPKNQIELSDIESSWAGLRPLINKPGKGPSEISRRDEMFVYPSGLITIAGGKLSGYRKMAERVVNKVSEKIYLEEGRSLPACTTDTVALPGGDMENHLHFEEYAERKIAAAVSRGINPDEAREAVKRYGSNSVKIFDIMDYLKREEQLDLPLLLCAELLYAIENEMCVTPSDFFIRRTGMLYFNKFLLMQWKDSVTSYMQKHLHWDKILTDRFKAELENEIRISDVTEKS